MIGEMVRELATACDGKVIDLIASGYNERVLPYAWLALMAGLAGIALPIDEPTPVSSTRRADPYADTERVVAEVRDNLKSYWTCLR